MNDLMAPMDPSQTEAVNALGATAPTPAELAAQERQYQTGASSAGLLASPPGALALRQHVLNQIASGESPDYNTIYGGHKFVSYRDHPRVAIPLPGGSHSDAAGRYQFLSSTWDSQVAKLGLKDFSPASQDEAAWDLASTVYKKGTGRELLSDAASNKVDWSKLAGTWPSLANGPKGAKPAQASATDSTPTATAPVGPNQGPELVGQTPDSVAAPSAQPKGPSANPLSALALIQTMFPQHKFTPVDYDPFKVAPKLNVPGLG